ncbi:chaperonin 10-like protein [Halenospora varia]|nr:chaperonin 10-like protein [Halenospora varia]
MTSQIPRSMRALALSKYCKPSEYAFATLPVPEIKEPDEILIRVKAASVNPVDVKMASGLGKLLGKADFPYKFGYDLSGVVVAIGSSVKNLKPGDEVYSRLAEKHRGSVAEYAISSATVTAKKPVSLNWLEAASMPLVSQTAMQSFAIAEKHFAAQGGLKGKTIYIPAGLSGTGSIAIQLAKNVYGAGKVVTTLSTGKISKIDQYLSHALPDQMIDYTKEKTVVAAGKESVDFMFDTTGASVGELGLMKRGGIIVSISSVPSGTQMKRSHPEMPFWLYYTLNFLEWMVRVWTGRQGVTYGFMERVGSSKDLDTLSQYMAEGKVKPIVGRVAKFSDEEEVRAGCQQICDAKGGVGKFVIEID